MNAKTCKAAVRSSPAEYQHSLLQTRCTFCHPTNSVKVLKSHLSNLINLFKNKLVTALVQNLIILSIIMMVVKAAITCASAMVLEGWEWTDNTADRCNVYWQVHVLVEVSSHSDHQEADSWWCWCLPLWGNISHVVRITCECECWGTAHDARYVPLPCHHLQSALHIGTVLLN